MLRRLLSAAIAGSVVATMMAACGQKGPLFLPDEPRNTAVTVPASPASPTEEDAEQQRRSNNPQPAN